MAIIPQFDPYRQAACFAGVLPNIHRIEASIDTAIGLTWGFTRELHEEMKQVKGGEFIYKPAKPKRGEFDGSQPSWWRAHATRPTVEQLDVMRKWCSKKNRFDIALDHYVEPGREQTLFIALAELVKMKWKHKHCLMKWYMDEFGNEGLYWEDTSTGKNPIRTIFLYHKRPGVVRLEIRFRNTASVRANGLDGWSEQGLSAINPREVARKHLTLAEINQSWVRQSVRHLLGRKSYRNRTPTEKTKIANRFMNRFGVYRGFVQRVPSTKLPDELIEAYFNLIPTQLTLRYSPTQVDPVDTLADACFTCLS